MPLFAQEDAENTFEDASEESAVIETEISPDSIIENEDASQPSSVAQDQKPMELSLEEQQFVRINQSLKNVIEENQKLAKQKDALQKDIESLRGERMVQETRLRALASERVNLLKKSEEIDNSKASYEKEIEGLKKELEDVKKNPTQEISLQNNEAMTAEGDGSLAQTTPVSISVMRGTDEIAKEMSKLVEENQILRKDTTKLHYNLANMFFEQGKYDMASIEYNRVLDLMPQDAATHYNLAFVSAEYLKDYKAAVLHYKKYLVLDPKASDSGFVRNQILELQLKMQNKIDSYIDKDKGDVDLPLK
jgi:tetratricopeptide (TPR) repeat protein